MGVRMPIRCVPLVSACLLLLAASVGNGTPLTITETTDFSGTAPGAHIGTLDVGVNTFVGRVDPLEDDYGDYFLLTLPAFTSLVAWELSITDFHSSFSVTNGSASVFGIPAVGSFLLEAVGGGFFLGASGFNIGGTGSGPASRLGPATLTAKFLYEPNVEPPLPLPPGWYAIEGGYDYRLAYTVESNVTAVPEPATLGLLSIGVAALSARRFKRSQQSP